MMPNKASFLYSRKVSPGYSVQYGPQIDKRMLECLLLNSKPDKIENFLNVRFRPISLKDTYMKQYKTTLET